MVGASERLIAYDPRGKTIVQDIPVPDLWGIRSISVEGYRATICTGSGRIRFADTRTGRLLPTTSKLFTSPGFQRSARPPYASVDPSALLASPGYKISGGFFDVDNEIYRQVFAPHPVEQGIYAHDFDPLGVRLFVGGGPSIQSIPGCNASLWW
jgi:hypothetical protein